MMTTTHAFVGAGLGLATAGINPELTGLALVVGALGGAVPDLDLLATHRRSLHFPVGFPVLTMAAVAVAIAVPSPLSMLVAVFLGAAAVHCAMDVFGGGVEPRPWEANSQRGVYNHLTGRWIRPKRWVRYAGAPEDFAVAVFAGLPVLAMSTGHAQLAVGALLVCSAVFTIYRRQLSMFGERLVR